MLDYNRDNAMIGHVDIDSQIMQAYVIFCMLQFKRTYNHVEAFSI